MKIITNLIILSGEFYDLKPQLNQAAMELKKADLKEQPLLCIETVKSILKLRRMKRK